MISIHHYLGLLHFPITKIPSGVTRFRWKNYFTYKHINLITLLGIFIIENFSNFNYYECKSLNFRKKKKTFEHMLVRARTCLEALVQIINREKWMDAPSALVYEVFLETFLLEKKKKRINYFDSFLYFQ